MSNPYESPLYDPHSPGHAAADVEGKIVPSSLVQQVRVVAILNGVQGGLEVLTGLLFASMAAFVPAMIAMDDEFAPPDAPPEMQQHMFWIMLSVYGGMGAGGLIAGVTRILATFKNWHFRSRRFGIVSLCLGLLSASTCYCIPTSVAMMIYGLIVYLNPSVAMAFEMGDQGTPADRIMYEFSPYRPRPDGQPQFR